MRLSARRRRPAKRDFGFWSSRWASSDSSLADAALAALLTEMSRWETLPPGESTENLTLLASALADEVPRYGIFGRQAAGELTQRMLRWPFQPEVEGGSALLADCQRVLEVVGEAGPSPTASLLDMVSGSRSDGASRSSSISLKKSAPSGRRRAVRDRIDAPGRSTPAPLAPVIAEDVGRPIEEEAPSELTFVTPLALLDNRAPLNVMRDLHNPSAERRAAAHAELLRRNFSDLEIAVARRLTDADPSVRASLAGDLPQIAGVDPQPWLIWLCQDEDADVRLTALSIIATSSDAAMLRQAEQIARRDRDPRVLELAEQILERRRAVQQ